MDLFGGIFSIRDCNSRDYHYPQKVSLGAHFFFMRGEKVVYLAELPAQSLEARKLFVSVEENEVSSSLAASSGLSSLPNGAVSPPSPTDAGNAQVTDEELLVRPGGLFQATDRRSLGSVPSPGAGH